MSVPRRLTEFVRRLHAIVGAPGLMIGVFSVLSFLFGIYVLMGEYDRPRETGRRAVHRVVAYWVRTPDYLGQTLVDYAAAWRRASPQAKAEHQEALARALNRLGGELDQEAERFPLIHVVGLRLSTPELPALARWNSAVITAEAGPDVFDTLPLIGESATARDGPSVSLGITYRIAPPLEEGIEGLEVSYRRLLLGLLGLSGFPLLCLGYMILNARNLTERVAREAAQEATLDLADRTCHELGNGVFVLANERRNLAEHLDLVERFIDEEPLAREAAARRAGVDPDVANRLHHALKREYANRGIDPDLELRGSAAIARHVCRQIDVCSEYISLTVRELDGFLKHSALPVSLEPTDLEGCFEEAVALLKPRLDACGAIVHRAVDPPGLRARADRRLLIHALVNLIKNAVEAVEASGIRPQILLTASADGRAAWISVSDNGPGIPPEALRRIFDVGYSTKGAGRGRGLGIVRESIQLQEGVLLVEPTAESGTRFRIHLDLDSTSLKAGDVGAVSTPPIIVRGPAGDEPAEPARR